MARNAKKRRGRKIKPNVERTPSGRISRAREPHEDTRLVALAYRQQQYGLNAEQAAHEKACTVLGRLWLTKKISLPLREAGERYLALKQNARKAIQAPDDLAKTGMKGGGGDIVGEDYISWAIRAVAAYEVARGWLDDIDVRSIVDRVVIENEECGDPGSLSELWKGLAYLAKRMGVDTETEKV